MPLRYTVTVLDCHANGHRWHERRGLSLPAAWRMVERHARRGVKRYGGALVRDNWGARGGAFPTLYRTAAITLDNPRRPPFVRAA